MSNIIKHLRVVALTGAVLLTSTGAALAASPSDHASNLTVAAASASEPAPDCVAPCTKLLHPQQKVVVGAPYYAFHSATVGGTATAFGAQFSVRYSPTGINYTTIYQTPTVSTNAFGAIFNMPGYYRVVALNTATSLLTTTASVNITVS
ncbi:MAG: hypothetical protein ABSH51_18210 [Solirubrobacteraceae bacterium]|jgi:hypothetical protein